MKIKLLYINIISIVMLVSLSQVVMSIIQITGIPPYAEHIRSIYKSGYFSEIENNFQIIKDSFLEIKCNTSPQYAWLFLEDMRNKYGIEVKVYDKNGFLTVKPGIKHDKKQNNIAKIIDAVKPKMHSSISFGTYTSLIPVFKEKRCSFCHKNKYSTVIGVLEFKRPYNAFVYFSAEKLIIFGVLLIIMAFLLYYTIKWDPARNIKELFDK